MNGDAIDHVQSISELTESGIKHASIEAKNIPAIHRLDASKLKITKTSNLRPVPELNSKEVWSFKACTDHMVKVAWSDDEGWHTPEIVPYGPLEMMPTASCLHYATQCFEGMKVYRGYDGKLRIFRPDLNAARLNLSSTRVALPSFDTEELVKLLHVFLGLEGPSKLV